MVLKREYSEMLISAEMDKVRFSYIEGKEKEKVTTKLSSDITSSPHVTH